MFRIRIQSKKKCIWYCSAVVSFLLFLLLLWCDHLANTQDAQQMAGRWSEKKDVAQISCFFSSKAEVTEDEFAYSKVKEGIGIDEKNVEIVENSRRYSLPNRIKTILAFGTRSMNGKAIIYPYWENLARGYEDIFAL